MRAQPLTTVFAGRGARHAAQAILTLGVLLLTACAGGRSRNPFDSSPGGQGVISIQIENRGFNDVRLYAITPAGSQSMGSVGGNTIRRETLNWRQIAQISFRIEVLAGRTYMTHTLTVQPGDRLELLIPNDPAEAILRPRTVPR